MVLKRLALYFRLWHIYPRANSQEVMCSDLPLSVIGCYAILHFHRKGVHVYLGSCWTWFLRCKAPHISSFCERQTEALDSIGIWWKFENMLASSSRFRERSRRAEGMCNYYGGYVQQEQMRRTNITFGAMNTGVAPDWNGIASIIPGWKLIAIFLIISVKPFLGASLYIDTELQVVLCPSWEFHCL